MSEKKLLGNERKKNTHTHFTDGYQMNVWIERTFHNIMNINKLINSAYQIHVSTE